MTIQVSFEQVREELDRLVAPTTNSDHSTFWVLQRLVGIARKADSSFEIFIVGPRVIPRTPTVRRHIEHSTWEVAESGELIEANRVILPPAPHFLSVAALIAIELVRAGIAAGRPLQDVFDNVEPLIELALRRGALGEEHVVGLIGELMCLEVMLDAISSHPQLRSHVLDLWQGYLVGRRDFVCGSASIEVKTTQNETSSHKISGLHQIEPDSNWESGSQRLFLLSVGLSETMQDGQSLPDVVRRISDRLADPEVRPPSPLQRRFFDSIAQYGAGSSRGYDHLTMADWSTYQTRYRLTFTPRIYDLTDPDIRLLRRRDLAPTCVDPTDIQYRFALAPTINGMNPAPSWRHAVISLTRETLGIV